MSGGPSDVERLVAIDVQVHAARNHDEPRDPATLEVLEAWRIDPPPAGSCRSRR